AARQIHAVRRRPLRGLRQRRCCEPGVQVSRQVPRRHHLPRRCHRREGPVPRSRTGSTPFDDGAISETFMVRRSRALIAFAIGFLVLSAGATVAYKAGSAALADPAPSTFLPTVANTAPPPRSAPDGMVWIPGGEFSMGAADPPGMDEVGMSAT